MDKLSISKTDYIVYFICWVASKYFLEVSIASIYHYVIYVEDIDSGVVPEMTISK